MSFPTGISGSPENPLNSWLALWSRCPAAEGAEWVGSLVVPSAFPQQRPPHHACSAVLATAHSHLATRLATYYFLINRNKQIKESVNMSTSVKWPDQLWYVSSLACSREPGSNLIRETKAQGSSPALQPQLHHFPRLASALQSRPLPLPRPNPAFL